MHWMQREDPRVSRTCVFLHAHPDDEALLTGGTMAGLAAQGHRVVLVVATAGENGLSGAPAAMPLEELRTAELDASAALIGCARVHHLGYADSGLDGSDAPVQAGRRRSRRCPYRRRPRHSRRSFATNAPTWSPATTPQAATVTLITCKSTARPPKRRDSRAPRCCWRPPWTAPCCYAPYAWSARSTPFRRGRRRRPANAHTPPEAITQRINVRPWARAKRAALSAHASQTTGGDTVRTVAALSALPLPGFRRVLGVEWYIRRTPLGED